MAWPKYLFMKKECQQTGRMLSQAAMKKLRGGNDYTSFAVCREGRSCTINGRAGTCRANIDDLVTCYCWANQAVQTAWGLTVYVGEVPECRNIQ
jgi:hypothetical protein